MLMFIAQMGQLRSLEVSLIRLCEGQCSVLRQFSVIPGERSQLLTRYCFEMSILRVRYVDDHFLFLCIEGGETTLNAYSFSHYWSSNNDLLPLSSNAVLVDTFVSAKSIEVEQNGNDTLLVKWNETETRKFSVDLSRTQANLIFRRLFAGISADADEIKKLSSANQELKSLADSAVKKYSDLAVASAEREQLLLSRFAALLERSKTQKGYDRVDNATIDFAPWEDEAADLPNPKSLVGERLMETLAQRIPPKRTCKRLPIPRSGMPSGLPDLDELT
ncbi:hypothetical protein ECG_07024 [Echinococcus granulosus]|nr:hypothetical protein ECG_07024 [Echinococcus granulosus]